MPSSTLKKFLPVIIMMGMLTIMGLGLKLNGTDVFWPGYFAMMFFYGLIFYLGTFAARKKETESTDDVLLAGRGIPLGIAVFTMGATWVGGGYINGTAEYTSSYGLAWVQAPWGYAMSLVIGGIFFAKKMRRFRFKTMLDPLEQRFGKRMTALLFIPALTGEIFWSAAILTALGTTFATVLGLDFQSSIIVSAVIAISYTAIGGLWSVAYTDVLQMFLLLGGLFLVIPFALDSVGGWDLAWSAYVEKKGALATLFPPIDGWRHPDWGNYFWQWWDYAFLLIFGGIPWQVYFQRVLSARSENAARWLSFLAAIICLIAAIPAVIIGVVGDVAVWSDFGVEAPEEAAMILPYVFRYLTNPVVATIGLGAIAAAVMSSVDSSILSASSLASWNVYRPLIKPQISPENLAKVIKKCIWIIGIAATLLALKVQSVYALWFLCSDFVFCILFPQLVCALFDKKANFYGSAAGLLVSFILRFGGGEATLNIPQIIPYPMVEDGMVLFPFRSLAMVSGLITIMIVSRLTQKICPAAELIQAEG